MTDPQDPFAAPGGQPPQPGRPPVPPPSTPPPPGYGPPGYGTPPAYGEPVAGYGMAAQGWNTLAIIGFVVSFLCSPAGIALGIIALNQVKRTGQRGRGLAIAAIVISSLSLVVGVLYAAGAGGR